MFVGICAPRRLTNVTLIVPPGRTWIVGLLSDVGPGTSESNGRAPSGAPETLIVCGSEVSLTLTVPVASGRTCAGFLSGRPALGVQAGGVWATLSLAFVTPSMSNATTVATTVSPRITVLPLRPSWRCWCCWRCPRRSASCASRSRSCEPTRAVSDSARAISGHHCRPRYVTRSLTHTPDRTAARDHASRATSPRLASLSGHHSDLLAAGAVLSRDTGCDR